MSNSRQTSSPNMSTKAGQVQIHGARSVIQASARRTDANPWLKGLLERRPTNVAAVALANKNARIVWAMMARDHGYEPLRAAA